MDALKREIRSAVMYPAFVFAAAVLIMLAVVIFIVPVFAHAFKEAVADQPGESASLPKLTQVMIGCRCTTEPQIRQILSDERFAHVDVVRYEMHETDFALVPAKMATVPLIGHQIATALPEQTQNPATTPDSPNGEVTAGAPSPAPEQTR